MLHQCCQSIGAAVSAVTIVVFSHCACSECGRAWASAVIERSSAAHCEPSKIDRVVSPLKSVVSTSAENCSPSFVKAEPGRRQGGDEAMPDALGAAGDSPGPSDSDCEASEQVVPGKGSLQQRHRKRFRHSSGSSNDSVGPAMPPGSPPHPLVCKREAVSAVPQHELEPCFRRRLCYLRFFHSSAFASVSLCRGVLGCLTVVLAMHVTASCTCLCSCH